MFHNGFMKWFNWSGLLDYVNVANCNKDRKETRKEKSHMPFCLEKKQERKYLIRRNVENVVDLYRMGPC